MSVPKVVEIKYTIYQGLSDPRYDCARNMSKEKSTRRLSPSFADILPLHVLPHSSPE